MIAPYLHIVASYSLSSDHNLFQEGKAEHVRKLFEGLDSLDEKTQSLNKML